MKRFLSWIAAVALPLAAMPLPTYASFTDGMPQAYQQCVQKQVNVAVLDAKQVANTYTATDDASLHQALDDCNQQLITSTVNMVKTSTAMTTDQVQKIKDCVLSKGMDLSTYTDINTSKTQPTDAQVAIGEDCFKSLGISVPKIDGTTVVPTNCAQYLPKDRPPTPEEIQAVIKCAGVDSAKFVKTDVDTTKTQTCIKQVLGDSLFTQMTTTGTPPATDKIKAAIQKCLPTTAGRLQIQSLENPGNLTPIDPETDKLKILNVQITAGTDGQFNITVNGQATDPTWKGAAVVVTTFSQAQSQDTTIGPDGMVTLATTLPAGTHTVYLTTFTPTGRQRSAAYTIDTANAATTSPSPTEVASPIATDNTLQSPLAVATPLAATSSSSSVWLLLLGALIIILVLLLIYLATKKKNTAMPDSSKMAEGSAPPDDQKPSQ